MKTRKICPLATRIKKMMQTDDDVGKISQATPILIGRAMELFLEKLCKQAISVAQSRQAKTLSPSHLKAAVTSDTTLDFLTELVATAPDLPAAEPEGTEAAPKPVKRRRTNDNGDGITSPQGRGGGRSSASAAAGTTGDQDTDDAPSARPARGRGSGGQRGGRSGGRGGQAKDNQQQSGSAPTGRRGSKQAKAAAAEAAAAAAGDPGPVPMSEDAAAVGPSVAGPSPHPTSDPNGTAPHPSTLPGTVGLASNATRAAEPGPGPRTAVKQEHGPSAGAGPGSTAAAGTGGGGGSIIASLRAQQPFFGLGRKGKNLGGRGSAASAPTPAGLRQPQQQALQQLPLHGSAEAAMACASNLDAELQPSHPFPLKLERLDMQQAAAGGILGFSTLQVAQQQAGPGLVASTSGTEDGVWTAAPRQPQADPSMMAPSPAGPGEQGGAGAPQFGLAGGNMVAGGMAGAPGGGGLMPPLGASLALFQIPQQPSGMDDDYDDC